MLFSDKEVLGPEKIKGLSSELGKKRERQRKQTTGDWRKCFKAKFR